MNYSHSDFYDDFIPYVDDSTETEYDHQYEETKVFDLSEYDDELPF